MILIILCLIIYVLLTVHVAYRYYHAISTAAIVSTRIIHTINKHVIQQSREAENVVDARAALKKACIALGVLNGMIDTHGGVDNLTSLVSVDIYALRQVLYNQIELLDTEI